MKKKLTLFLFACSLFVGNTIPCFAAGTQGSFLAEATTIPEPIKEEFAFENPLSLRSSVQTPLMQIETVTYN